MKINIKEKGNNKYWWISILKGILLVCFGFWLFKSPIESINKINLLFGIIILASGIVELMVSYTFQNTGGTWRWLLSSGLFDIFLGLFLITNPKFILLIITFIISFWLIYRGVLNIREALLIKKQQILNWKRKLTTGIILIVLAGIFIWHPQIIGITIVFWTALAFISLGIFRIILAFKIIDKKGSDYSNYEEIE